ncbi:response regulator transcription factor [Shinella sp. HZN7]|uniref:response regulator n=1 Tax=Shinella sp. (strain HZN7) TaxID=879274 RepID=UPI000B044578|nr:response regulator transcription factor [Shinella sp. HZN7]
MFEDMKARGARLDVLIADDHPLIRAGLRAILAARPGWFVCAEAETGEAALRLARALRPRLAVLDYSLPGINGLEVTRQLCRDMPGFGVLIYTMHADERMLAALLEAGARGYVLKTEDDAALLAAMDAVAAGGTYISPNLARQRPAQNAVAMLTPREIEVVRLVALGETNKSIAAQLDVSVKTVDTHRTTAMRKLGLHTAVDVALFAVRNRLIEP